MKKVHFGYESYRPGNAATSPGAQTTHHTMCGRDYGSVLTTNVMHDVTCIACMKRTRPSRLSNAQQVMLWVHNHPIVC